MLFKIRYFRDAMQLADVAFDDVGGDPMTSASAGLARYHATHAVLLDDQGNELAIVRGDRA